MRRVCRWVGGEVSRKEFSHRPPRRRVCPDLDVPDATFARLDLVTFCRLDELCLEAFGQRLGSARAMLACRVVETDQ